MLFNSLEFLFFFPVVTLLYFLLQHRFRWFLLLAASCYFYMFFRPIYILILAFTIVIDYFAGIYIEKSTGNRRKVFLISSLIANIGVLSIFKYYNFFIENINIFSSQIGSQTHFSYLSILLPIGLSFHTFQAMSYTIEVYQGKQKAEHHFGIYALYVMFYPQLVAGPIERPQNILHQFYEKHIFNYANVTSGLRLMAWGMFKKVVIGDHLAIMVDKVYNHPMGYQGIPLIISTVFFAFQIYCDFSGYSDIAVGSARVMGFTLMKNFNRPYFSKSIGEFWRRWHISLSTWFRDYLYIPLGGNKVGYFRQLFNLFFVFLVSGLWHGASWNFVLWGAIHGLLLVLERLRNSFLSFLKISSYNTIGKLSNILVTFLLVDFSWIFFRARTWADAKYIVTHLFTNIHFSDFSNKDFIRNNIFLGESKQIFFITILSTILMLYVHFLQRYKQLSIIFMMKPRWIRWSIYYVFVCYIILFGAFEKPAQFIYFQF